MDLNRRGAQDLFLSDIQEMNIEERPKPDLIFPALKIKAEQRRELDEQTLVYPRVGIERQPPSGGEHFHDACVIVMDVGENNPAELACADSLRPHQVDGERPGIEEIRHTRNPEQENSAAVLFE